RRFDVHLYTVAWMRCPRGGREGRRQKAEGRSDQRGNALLPSALCLHPFTEPAMIPLMYCRCRATNISSTGSTVTTDPAIINSTSCTCSPERFASATGRV